MKIGVGLCGHLLQSRDRKMLMKVLDSGIRAEVLQEDEAVLFNAMMHHFNEYGTVPEKESLRGKVAGVLLDQMPSVMPEPLDFYIHEVKQRKLAVDVQEALTLAIKEIEQSKPADAIRIMQSLVHGSTAAADGLGAGMDLRDTARQRWEQYEHLRDLRLANKIDGIPFPWGFVNDFTFGLHAGDFAVLVGRIGVGKTWLLLHCALASWRSGLSPLIVTTEMTAEGLGRRIDAMMAGISYTDFTRGQLGSVAEEHVRLVTLKDYQEMPPLIVVGSPKIRSAEDLHSAIRTYQPTGGVFLDGVNRIRGGKSNDRYQRVAEAADELKAVADSTSVSILGSTHFNRQGGKTAKAGTKGDMEDIGYGYAIAEQATMLFGLMQPDDLKIDNQILVKVMKAREAKHPEGFVVNCNPDTMNFGIVGQWNDGQVEPIIEDSVADEEEVPF